MNADTPCPHLCSTHSCLLKRRQFCVTSVSWCICQYNIGSEDLDYLHVGCCFLHHGHAIKPGLGWREILTTLVCITFTGFLDKQTLYLTCQNKRWNSFLKKWMRLFSSNILKHMIICIWIKCFDVALLCIQLYTFKLVDNSKENGKKKMLQKQFELCKWRLVNPSDMVVKCRHLII